MEKDFCNVTKKEFLEDVYCEGCDNIEEILSSKEFQKIKSLLEDIEENENKIVELNNTNDVNLQEIAKLFDFTNKIIHFKPLDENIFVLVKGQKVENIGGKLYLTFYGSLMSLIYSANSISYYFKDNTTHSLRLTYNNIQTINILSNQDIINMDCQMHECILKNFNVIKKKTFFISGHRDLTEEEFKKIYKPVIDKVIEKYDAYFIMGDYQGCDLMAQNYLINELNYDVNKITVYHMFSSPNFYNKKIINFRGGYENDYERDTAMTLNSDEDIAYVRNLNYSSGTAQNLVKRKSFFKINEEIQTIEEYGGK